MFGLHPFFNVTVAGIWRLVFVELDFGVRVEVVTEMLQKGYFFLELPLGGIIAEFVGSDGICLVTLLFLDVFKVLSVFVHDYFCRIVEVHSSRAVG
jgi:fucose 4-O-acetylase-like acetyltransferase